MYSCDINNSQKKGADMQYIDTTFEIENRNEEIISEPKFNQNLSFQAEIKIINMVQIGWGTSYKCELVSILDGNIESLDSTFFMSASVGSERIYKEILYLEVDENYIIDFFRSGESNLNSVPAGTTGFLDKHGTIWLISALKKAE
jgi:hypothetical protein